MDLPRHFNEQFKCDNKSIQNKLIEAEINDHLFIKNVLSGTIITSNIYPLIYDNESQIPEQNFRSIPFYKRIINQPDTYQLIPEDLRIYYFIGLRDLYYSYLNDLLTTEEIDLVKRNIIYADYDSQDYLISYDGLLITPFPTSTNILLRYMKIDLLSNTIDLNMYKNYFITNSHELSLVFINPQLLSYHNFENIINLDGKLNLPNPDIGKCELISEDIIMVNLKQNLVNKLLKIDKLNIYSPPLNSNQRGGKRLIFKSHELSGYLTEIVKNTNLFDKSFKFVNHVFRYNKFSPTDTKFIAHYDTPYYDGYNHHYSTHTLIIYLTPSNTGSILKFINEKREDININTIKAGQCIIFKQDQCHEGYPYIDNDKIFIRSELIFDAKNIEHNQPVADLFNIACYMTKESMFSKELENYAAECFNYVTMMRFKLATPVKKIKYLFKDFDGIKYLTNGCTFWFCSLYDIRCCALIVLIDYFNCKMSIDSQIKIIKTRNGLSDDFISSYLENEYMQNNVFFNTQLYENFGRNHRDTCSHRDDCTTCSALDRLYYSVNKSIYKKFNNFSLTILNEKILLVNTNDMFVDAEKIFFQKTGFFKKFNFAAASSSSSSIEEATDDINIKYNNLPAIRYVRSNGCYKLSIDAFNNDFIYGINKDIQITYCK